MNPRTKTTFVLLFALLLFVFTVSAAQTPQTPTQGDQIKKAEACCAMDSCCCCKGDSCDMDMKADGTMKHDMKDMKHDMKDHKGDCCKAKAKEAKKQ